MEDYQIILPCISDFLAHLHIEDIRKMAHEYYHDSEPRHDLIKRYGISTESLRILPRLLPPFLHKDCICPECNVISWLKIGYESSENQPFCPRCSKVLLSDLYSVDTLLRTVEPNCPMWEDDSDNEKPTNEFPIEYYYYTTYTY